MFVSTDEAHKSRWNGAYAGAHPPSVGSTRVGYRFHETTEPDFTDAMYGVRSRGSQKKSDFAYGSVKPTTWNHTPEVQRVHMYTGSNDSIWEMEYKKAGREFSLWSGKDPNLLHHAGAA